MQNNMEGILNDLVQIDNIALDISKKRETDLANIKEEYMAEVEKMEGQLDSEKANIKKYLEQAAIKAQEEAKAIEADKEAAIIALENKFTQTKEEILRRTILTLFGMEMY